MKKLSWLLLLLMLSLTACVEREISLPQAGIHALDLEIRHGSLTQFEEPYSISTIESANMDLVIDRYNQYFCVTVSPEIPAVQDSQTKYRHYVVVREENVWRASTEDSSAFQEWQRIGCDNWGN